MTKTDLAAEFHGKGFNCCQSVLLPFAEELKMSVTDLIRCGEGFGLGMGNTENTCGAVSGAVLCMGLLHSAGNPENPIATKKETMALSASVTGRFSSEHGSTICKELKGLTGMPVVPCDRCIRDAATYVEEYLNSADKK